MKLFYYFSRRQSYQPRLGMISIQETPAGPEKEA